ncbi:MFS transporter [Cupriavidus basilensis]|uniref:MFS transporter n=1 Tax=Cupriavidus basilensis TaxID=68895 RepID=A0ABT6AVG5_9BURK|nr:MFS transporter [Cupriavidus basilensis]MDF3835706.1 MFS transporter [Cupriavidus basilensis]
MNTRTRSHQRLSYGVGSIGTGIFTTVPSVLLLYFLTVEVRIDAAIAGVIILIPKAIGLVGDPLIGVWADRLRHRSPCARQALMASGALLGGAGLWALFGMPQRYPGNALVPMLIYFLCTTGYSFFAVPYSALPAELDDRPEGRRALVSTRLGLAFLGVLIGGVSAPLVTERAGYPAMGIAMGAVCLVAMGAFVLTCRLNGAVVHTRPAEFVPDTVPASRLVSRPFFIQMSAFVMLLAAVGAFSALLPFLVRAMRASGDVVGIAMLINIVTALLFAALWPRLISRLGLRSVWQLAATTTCAAALMVGVAPSPGLMFFVGMSLGGVGLSGMQIAGFTGLADLTAEHLASGRGSGIITGIWMAGEKAGLASGPLLAGFGLKFLGETVADSAARSSVVLIPTVLAILAIVTIAFDPTGGRPSPRK